MLDILLRPMRPQEAPAIQSLFRTSFPDHLHRYMVYGQSGLSHYLHDLCLNPDLFPQFVFTVAISSQGDIVGYTEFRNLGGTGFLSNIFIDRKARGKGLGTRMVQHFLHNHPEVKTLELDVLESNAGAKRLYERIGFAPIYKNHWQVTDINSQESIDEVKVSASISDIAMHARYGFSEIEVDEGLLRLKIGRLGDHVVRQIIACSEAVASRNTLFALRNQFPSTNSFFTISDQRLPGASEIDISSRMRWIL